MFFSVTCNFWGCLGFCAESYFTGKLGFKNVPLDYLFEVNGGYGRRLTRIDSKAFYGVGVCIYPRLGLLRGSGASEGG